MEFNKIIFAIFCLLIPFTLHAGGNTTISSFSKAKKLLLNKVYHDHRVTFYCKCPYRKNKTIIKSNKFSPTTKHFKRSLKVEWEHVVPAQSFGKSFKEWRKGHPNCVNRKDRPFKGRKCAEKVNMQYRYMQAQISTI